MNYYAIDHRIRSLSELVVESYKEGDINADKAREQLLKLEEFAYESFPHLEPDGDITFGIAMKMDEIK